MHTGQHYDSTMSDVFFRELDLPSPDYELGVGSGPHGAQTGRMLEGVEDVIVRDRPDVVLVVGDTNSTLAGALASAKLGVPVAHVEAGLRSYRREMPEEINRVLTDHVSSLLFCPSNTSVANLRNEGIEQGIHQVGDVMFDVLSRYLPPSEERARIVRDLGVDQAISPSRPSTAPRTRTTRPSSHRSFRRWSVSPHAGYPGRVPRASADASSSRRRSADAWCPSHPARELPTDAVVGGVG